MSKSHAQKPETHAPTHEEHDDELIVNPRGTSRAQFLIILGLMIFTLIIFTVGDSLQSAVSSGPGSGAPGFGWERPGAGKQSVDQRSFMLVKRQLDDFFRVQNRRSRLSDEDTAVFMVVNDLAKDAGIAITNEELADAIMNGAGRLYNEQGVPDPEQWSMAPMMTKETYESQLAVVGVSAPRFEDTLRDVLRVNRYITLVSAAASQPSSDEVLDVWKESNQEFAYDYIQVSYEDFVDEVSADLPTDEELATWYEELPTRTQVFREEMQQDRTAAELVGLLVEGPEDAAGLLVRYPAPADLESDELAREYYDTVRTTRFRRETPLEELPENEDGTPADPTDRIYFPFEEVVESARREAPIHKALVTWLGDLALRVEAGEELDLAQEAADLGLFYSSDGVARENQEWIELEGLGSNYLANAIRAAGFQPSSLSAAVTASPEGLFIARVVEKTPAGLPPMADIRERVVEEWTQQQATVLALEKMQDFYASLAAAQGVVLPEDWKTEQPPALGQPVEDDEDEDEARVALDEAAFRAAAEAAGFTVARRDWLPGFTMQTFSMGPGQAPLTFGIGPTRFDPQADQPANKYLNGTGMERLESLDEGQLDPPATDSTKEHVFLVRKAGQRAPVEIRMPLAEFEDLRNSQARSSREEFAARYFSAENFAGLYGLDGFWNDVREEGAGEESDDPES